jgi:hypothetical protein
VEVGLDLIDEHEGPLVLPMGEERHKCDEPLEASAALGELYKVFATLRPHEEPDEQPIRIELETYVGLPVALEEDLAREFDGLIWPRGAGLIWPQLAGELSGW